LPAGSSRELATEGRDQRAGVTLRRPSLSRSARAGIAGSVAYLLAQAVDRRLAPNRYDDLVLWGGFLTRDPRRQRLTGAAIHFSLGIALAAAYDALWPLLPGRSGVVRGVVFVQMENALLYPGVPLLNAIHPSVRSGELPSLLTWRYFWVEVARHAAFGAVLGLTIGEDED
jgi:hypothetical protein